MSTRRRVFSLFSFGSALVALSFLSGEARAETMPAPFDAGYSGACWGTTILPRTDGLSLPANTPALAFESTITDGTRTTTVVDLALYGPSGDLIDAKVSGDPVVKSFRLLVPAAPLVPGKGYTLRLDETCTGDPSGPTSNTLTRTFDVGPNVTLPPSLGTIMATPSAYGDVELNAILSPDMFALLPTAAMSLHMKGDEATYGYGYGVVTSEKMRATVFPCGARPLGSRAKGTAELTAHIAGASVDPAPVTLDFEVTCPAGGEPFDFEGGPVGDYEMGRPVDDMPDPSSNNNNVGCGCRVSAGVDTTAPYAGIVAGLAGLATLVCRRRRARVS
jgi:hypothetical protein